MPDLLLKDVDQAVIDKLTLQASLNGSTLEEIVHKAIREAADREAVSELEVIRRLRSPNIPKRDTEEG